MKIDKFYIIDYIVTYLSSYFKENDEIKCIDYSIVIGLILNDKYINTYVNKRKNKYLYIDNLLKLDNHLKLKLEDINVYYLNNKFVFECNEIKRNRTEVINENINFDGFYPYEFVINKFKTKRNTTSNKKTNEKVLNYTLSNDKVFNNFIYFLDKDIELNNFSVKELSDKIIILYKNKYIYTLNFLYYNYSTENKFNLYLNKLKKSYPFNYFNYNSLLISSYIFCKLNYYKHAKYNTILLFDSIVENLSKRYFHKYSGLINSKIYDLFFYDKLNDIKLEDYYFINNYFSIIENNSIDFVSFSIGLYKIIIYLKNKYNREIKNIALELYNNNENKINNIISINDVTENNNIL